MSPRDFLRYYRFCVVICLNYLFDSQNWLLKRILMVSFVSLLLEFIYFFRVLMTLANVFYGVSYLSYMFGMRWGLRGEVGVEMRGLRQRQRPMPPAIPKRLPKSISFVVRVIFSDFSSNILRKRYKINNILFMSIILFIICALPVKLMFLLQQQVKMSRSQPYRSRIPVHVMQLLDVASRITLFLVGQAGPLCFTFKDRLDNKYRTQIGPELRCSCSPQRNDHCIHTIYVLLKIFRVAVDNPIIWQAAYVDSQLQDLLAGKHSQVQQRRPRPHFQEMPFPELPSEFLQRKVQERWSGETENAKVQRMVLGEEAVCPVCQQQMKEDMCLSWCKIGCGNNFHLECLRVWARHRAQEQANVNCPMCRAKFPHSFLHQLEREQREHAKRQSQKIKIIFDCSGCGLKGIPTSPHKCLLCTSYQLCQPCYASGKHVKHPFIRQDGDGRWRGAEQRRVNELKLKNYIQSKRKQSFNDEMLKKLRKIQEDPSKLLDFVAAAYPYVSRYISDHIDPLKKMDFSPSDLRCQKCSSTKMLFLRRLSCGHFIDHQCLKDCILKDRFYCSEDGSQFLKGFQNLRQKEKENDNKRQQQMIGIASQFDVRHIEEPQNEIMAIRQSYNFIGSPEQPTLTEILSARQPSLQRRPDQLRVRITNNIIRDQRPNIVRENTPQRQQTRQTPPRPQIRVRNVAVSSKSRGEAPRNQVAINVRQQSSKKKREDLNFMIEALIGRKLK